MLKKTAFLCLGVLTLSACSTSQPGIEVRTVEVPVPVACLPADQIPPEPMQIDALLSGDPARDISLVAQSALRLRAWGRELAAALHGCAR
jgi:hypothetical protein